MSETPAIYKLDDEGDTSDTEKLAAVSAIQVEKQQRLLTDMCEYLTSHMEWIPALNEQQATTLLLALVNQHPTAVQKLIDAQEQGQTEG